METKRENPIPEGKIKTVKELKDLLTNKKTILIASIKNLPSSQLQEISKSLRGNAIIKVPKKNLLFRAIDATKDEDLKKLKDHFKGSVAILFSDNESFDLAADVLKNKTPAKAKPGQEAPEDILISAGPTELPPGPAISELGAVGLQVQIENGKITIREDKVIVEQGGIISDNAADVMSKLGILPFSIGLIPLSAFDNVSKTMYSELNIDPEGALEALTGSFGKSLAFAVSIGYASTDTIKFLLGKAGAYEKALAAVVDSKADAPAEEEPKGSEAPKAEEAKEETPAESQETQTPETKSEAPEAKAEEAAPAETPAETTEAPAESTGEEK